jgi:hypothetical protein
MSSASDGLHDFNPVARGQPVLGVCAPRRKFTIDFHGISAALEPKQLDQDTGCDTFGHFPGLAVQDDFHCNPLFYTRRMGTLLKGRFQQCPHSG